MSNEYGYQSYLYPAGSAASGGGAGSGTGTAAPAKPLQIGTVETLPEGSAATATLEETVTNTVLNLGIPQGTHGAKGDMGDTGTVDAGIIKSALGSTIMQRMQALLPHFEAAFVAKPADLKNNEWYQVKFQQQFDDVDLDKPVVLVQPLLNDYRYFLVRNVTAQGFEFKCPYIPDFLGLYYVKFTTA